MLTVIDWFILTVLLLSALLSLVRGGIYEAISIGGIVLGFFVSSRYGPEFAANFLLVIEDEGARSTVSYVMVFIITVFIATIFSLMLRKILRSIGLGGFDRALGTLVGLVKGYALLMVVSVAALYTPLPKSDIWLDSMLLPPITEGVEYVRPFLPDSVAKFLDPEEVSTSDLLKSAINVTPTGETNEPNTNGPSEAPAQPDTAQEPASP